MAGGEEKEGEGSVGEQLPLSHGPPQHLSQGIPGELPQDRPSLRQPQLSLPHPEDKQEEDDEEESQRTEVQLSAPQLFGDGCARGGRALSPLVAQCSSGERRGSRREHQVVISHFPRGERLVWSVSPPLLFLPSSGSLPLPWCTGQFWIAPLSPCCIKTKDKLAYEWPG